jgi:cbb3-type cytochrome oxidase maturation protein
MPLGLWLVVGWMLLVAMIGIAFLIWGWRGGQFRDIEEPKYRMLEDREPEPWPDRQGWPGFDLPAKEGDRR